MMSGSRSASIHFQSQNSGCLVAMLTSLSLPQEAAQIPVLELAFPLAAPQHALELRRQIVFQPLGAIGDALDEVRRDAGFLLELAQRGRPRLLALVDPALRHLPRFVGIIDATSDPHLLVRIEQHDADTPAVEMVVVVIG